MQAEICKDHPVSNQDEEADTATEVSMCLEFSVQVAQKQ
jgi:hypothetical protein